MTAALCIHCGSPITPRDPATRLASVLVPIRTVTESNAKENPFTKNRRSKAQKSAVGFMLRAHVGRPFQAPLHVVLTRISPRDLDPDNRVSSQKHVIDSIAEWLGIDDGDDRVTYQVQAERGRPKQYAVRVEIYKGESR